MNVSAADTLVDPTLEKQGKKVSYTQPRRLRRWVAILVIVAIVLLIAAAIRILGQVSGQEFSPDTFRVRRFHFYEIPYLELQVSPIRRSVFSPATSTYLRKNSLLDIPAGNRVSGGSAATDSPAITWHLASMSRGMQGDSNQDAMLLVQLLNMHRNGNVGQDWTQWSTDHPQHAAYFWPVIQRLARRELYFLIPRLFEIAQQDFTVEELRQQVQTQIKEEYASLIQDVRAANRMDLVQALSKEQALDQSGDVPSTDP